MDLRQKTEFVVAAKWLMSAVARVLWDKGGKNIKFKCEAKYNKTETKIMQT